MILHKKTTLIFLFFFFLLLNVFCQKNVETLYKNRQYEVVIDSLLEKNVKEQLTLDEYYMLTRSFGRTKRFSNGLIFAKKMQDIALKNKDTANLVRAINLAAENFVDLDAVKEGLNYSSKMIPFFREKDSIEYQKFCFKLGVMYYYDKDYVKAYDTYNQITKKEYRNLNLFNANYALTLKGLKKWDEAIFYYKKALKDTQKKGYDDGVCRNHYNIASIYREKKNWNLAKEYLDSSRGHSLKSNIDVNTKINIEEQYFELYQAQNKTQKAHDVLDAIKILNSQLMEERLNEEIQAVETSNKRELILKEKVKIIDNRLEVSEKQKLWGALILLFVIMFLVTIVFLYKYKNIKAVNNNILAEQRLLRLQMDPHFIFNSLSVLQGIILNNERMKAVKYVSKFSKLLRIILESSREKMVSINSELEVLENYIDLQSISRSNVIKYTLLLDSRIKGDDLLIPPMLIQPFVENAIEHGFEGVIENPEIIIDIQFKEEKLQCDIKDNGVGINASLENNFSNKKSLSTKITSERLEIISKQHKVLSSVSIKDRSEVNEQGTHVQLTLPYIVNKDKV